MILGFSGSRRGSTRPQRDRFCDLLIPLDLKAFHHGDCVGWDQQAHDFVRQFKPDTKIHIWPPTNSKYRAFCRGNITHAFLSYAERNVEIVHASQRVIACPKGLTPELGGSGTWYVINLCRTFHVPLTVIWPDGQVNSNE